MFIILSTVNYTGITRVKSIVLLRPTVEGHQEYRVAHLHQRLTTGIVITTHSLLYGGCNNFEAESCRLLSTLYGPTYAY